MAALREKKISVHRMHKDQCQSLLRVALNGLVDMLPGAESTLIEGKHVDKMKQQRKGKRRKEKEEIS